VNVALNSWNSQRNPGLGRWRDWHLFWHQGHTGSAGAILYGKGIGGRPGRDSCIICRPMVAAEAVQVSAVGAVWACIAAQHSLV